MELYSLGTREYDPFDQTIQMHAHAIYIPGALFPLPLAPGQGNEIRGLFFPLTAKKPSLDCGDVLKNANKRAEIYHGSHTDQRHQCCVDYNYY